MNASRCTPRTVVSRIRLASMPGVGTAFLHNVIATATGSYRKTVGANALVRDEQGRLLLGRPTYPPRQWDLPGGRVERDESPDEALPREVLEETGLEIRIERLALVDARGRSRVIFVFECSVVGGTVEPAVGEIAALRWAGEAELDEVPADVRERIRQATAPGGTAHYLS